jgi:hypothetical protein
MKGKGSSSMRLSKMHVLVEPINSPDAAEWVEYAMESAYRGMSQPSFTRPCELNA